MPLQIPSPEHIPHCSINLFLTKGHFGTLIKLNPETEFGSFVQVNEEQIYSYWSPISKIQQAQDTESQLRQCSE